MLPRLVFLTACLAARASAHDFWIEPSTFRPVAGQTFTATLRVGQDFDGDAVPRNAQLIDSFTVHDATGQRPVNGFENQDPAGYIRIDRPGIAVIGYRSKANPLELSAEKFNQFLQQEGLHVPGSAKTPHRERFFRYAKALVGKGSGKLDHRFGYRLEIVPESLEPLRIRLLFEGKPLAGALVTALQPPARLSARTDARGGVVFSLPKGGVWLVKSVHLVAAPPESNVEWETLWASLTFER